MMTSIRSFIAIELPNQAQAALTDLQNQLKTKIPSNSVRWTAPQNIHLTLHFLGDIPADKIAKVEAALQSSTLAYQPFSLVLGNLGCFPNVRRPRVVWVGILGNTASLVKLHGELGQRLNQAIDFSPETRPYSPHLTIGRVTKGIPRRQLTQLTRVLQREQAAVGQLAPLEVTEVSLMKSELNPTGAVYTQLVSATLR